MRTRVAYFKQEQMRYTGHLDLYRTWERLIRRAKLPLSYTQGYNPHPKVNLSPALPLGFTSECELIDIWLEEDLPLEKILSGLRSAAPPGIRIQEIEEIEESEPAIQNLIYAVEYRVRISDPPANILDRIRMVLSANELLRTRRNKSYNLRPLIESIKTKELEDHRLEIFLRLACRDGATGRPDEVLKALDYPPHLAEIHRLNFIAQKDIQLV